MIEFGLNIFYSQSEEDWGQVLTTYTETPFLEYLQQQIASKLFKKKMWSKTGDKQGNTIVQKVKRKLFYWNLLDLLI